MKEDKNKKNNKAIFAADKVKNAAKTDDKPSEDIDDLIFEEEGYKCSEK